MTIPITWLQYWKTAGVVALVYYAVVLALFFRADIKKLLTAKHRKKQAPKMKPRAPDK